MNILERHKIALKTLDVSSELRIHQLVDSIFPDILPESSLSSTFSQLLFQLLIVLRIPGWELQYGSYGPCHGNPDVQMVDDSQKTSKNMA